MCTGRIEAALSSKYRNIFGEKNAVIDNNPARGRRHDSVEANIKRTARTGYLPGPKRRNRSVEAAGRRNPERPQALSCRAYIPMRTAGYALWDISGCDIGLRRGNGGINQRRRDAPSSIGLRRICRADDA